MVVSVFAHTEVTQGRQTYLTISLHVHWSEESNRAHVKSLVNRHCRECLHFCLYFGAGVSKEFHALCCLSPRLKMRLLPDFDQNTIDSLLFAIDSIE